MEQKQTQKSRNKDVGIIPADFKIYYQARVIKTTWYRKKTDSVQWTTTESPETNPHISSELIFNKGAEHTNRRRKVFFSNGAGETRY